MIRFMCRTMRRDDGMSVLEIMIAAVILFIVLTGVLGLVGQTTLMGVDAKQRNVMVNALNTYIERVQSLPFDTVNLDADGGALASEETTTVGEFTVVIRPSVDAGANASLKTLTVAITVSANGRASASMTTTIPIRDRSQFMTQANRTPETDPSIEFIDAYTPAEGAVVWDSSCTGATGVLKLAVDAEASEGRLITNVALWIDDSYVAKDTLGNPANWNPATQAFNHTSFVWDTRQTEDVIQEDGSYLPVEIIADGMRTVSAYVLDDQGVSVYTVRHLLVDNHEPGVPGVPVAAVTSNAAANISWLKSSDGTTDADHYQLRLFKQPISDTDGTSPFERWPEVSVGTPTDTTLSFTGGTSFSRYYPAVRALSPRELPSAYTVGTPIFVTRPLITGGYTIAQSNKTYTVTSTLSCSTPTFPTSGLTYQWYRFSEVAPTPVAVGTGATLSANAYSMTLGNKNDPCPKVSYYCVVSFTPLGVDGGTVQTKTSNTIATTAVDIVSSTPYGVGSW